MSIQLAKSWDVFRASCLLAVGFAFASAGHAADPAAEQLQKLLADAWESDMQEFPLFATSVGDHRGNDQLDRVTLADETRRDKRDREFLARWQAISRTDLTGLDRVNYDIFGRSLREAIAEREFAAYLMPIDSRSGFHISFPELRRDAPLVTTEDYVNYIARLAAFRQFSRDHIELMREGIRREMTQPAVIMEGYEESLTPHIVEDPSKSLLYQPLLDLPDTVPESEHERLRAAAKEAIAGGVVPGYRDFLQFMQQEYMPNARGTIAAAALPNGREFYRHRIRKFTTLDDLTPEQVHARGLAEVERIRSEMEKIIERVEFDGTFAEFVDYLRTDPKFYAQTPEELLEKASHILKRADGELPKLFGRLPRMPYGIRPIPAYIAPKTTSAYYSPPAGDGTVAGFYNLNTYNLPSRELYTLESLSLHEAVPGHHLQIALQQEIEELPMFRRFGGSTAFVEGWALYSERLGHEMGFYTDPYSDFGRLTMEMWRACRLVVDTGMHYLGWTREQALDFMQENSAMSLHNIRSEVDRYIGWPGQALAYKIGELKIRELRATAEQELGEEFDIRAFHDVVLGSGAVPLAVLEVQVRKWIKSQPADR